MNNKIPKEFQLMGQTIKVEFLDNLSQTDDVWGMAQYRLNKIKLQKNGDTYKRTDEQLAETFYHELVHFILNSMEEYKLRGDEKFVGLFSSLLYQFMKTKKE